MSDTLKPPPDPEQVVKDAIAALRTPRAPDLLPDIEVLSTVTRSPHHPLGVKGIGEAGTIAQGG